MEIPILTKFVNGLKLFFASKRLRWLTLIFFIGAALIYTMERLIVFFPGLQSLAIGISALFPYFWMLVTLVSLFGLQRFIGSDESYRRSAFLTVIWMVVSVVLFIISFLLAWGVLLIIAFLGFFIWIAFQGYFSTRTALGIATGVDMEHRSKIMTVIFGVANIFNYVILVAAALFTFIFINPVLNWIAIGGALVGLLVAAGFNFLNGIIIAAERNRATADNLTLLGLFVSLYSAYFIYNVLKQTSLAPDLVGIAVTIFFLLYTMSGVGRSLSSRAEMDTRFKISKELAATFTFFLASSYVFVDVMFTLLLTPAGFTATDVAPISAIFKLWLFPLIALVVELRFIWRSRRAPKPAKVPEEAPVPTQGPAPVEEETPEEAEAPAPVEEEEPEAEETPVPVEGEESEEEEAEPDVEGSSEQSALEPSDDDSGPEDSGESDSSEDEM